MEVTLAGIDTYCKELQLEKVYCPIEVTFEGMVIAMSDEQEEKALSAIDNTPFGIVNDTSDVQYSNVPYGIYCSLLVGDS